MVNDRTLKGHHLTAHPLTAEGEPMMLYTRTPPVVCKRAENGGRLDTPQGEKTFHAGDWICTDYPPTYAWIIDQQGFAYANYTELGTVEGDMPVAFRVAEADHEVEHTRYRGIAEPEQSSKQVVEVDLIEVETTTTPAHPSQKVTVPRQSHPPTKATLPQQNPQKAMSQPRAPKRA